MPVEESKKRDIVQNITALLRNSQLAGSGSVDVQRLAMAFSMVLDNVDEGQPIELQSLYDYLLEQKLPEQSIAELCVVLKGREERLGVVFVNPRKVDYLSPEQIAFINEKFNARADKASGFDKKGPVDAKGAPVPQQGSNWVPDKRKRLESRAALKIVLAVLVVAAGAFYAWYFSTKKPPMVQITATDPAGLKCEQLMTNGAIATCTLAAAAAQVGTEALTTRGNVTLRELSMSRNVKVLYVIENKTRRVLIRLPPR